MTPSSIRGCDTFSFINLAKFAFSKTALRLDGKSSKTSFNANEVKGSSDLRWKCLYHLVVATKNDFLTRYFLMSAILPTAPFRQGFQCSSVTPTHKFHLGNTAFSSKAKPQTFHSISMADAIPAGATLLTINTFHRV